MDDKFNQWCLENTGRPAEKFTGSAYMLLKSDYKITLLDAEILELKRRIEILEGGK